MKKYIKNICGALAAVTALTACDSKLDLTDPTKLTDEQIESLLVDGTPEEQQLIFGGMAAGLKSYLCYRGTIMSGGFSNMSIDNEWVHNNMYRNLQCGDIVYGDGARHSSGWGQYYRNSQDLQYWDSDRESECYGFWGSPAISISKANNILMYLTDEIIEKSNSALLKQYKAQALVIRGMGYMQLMERFTKAYLHGGQSGHGMPIYTTYGYNETVAPSSATDTWNFIIKDLTEAVNLFKESGLGTGGYTIGTTGSECYDIDCGVAQYFLAKAAMWTGNYQTAITACNDVMNAYNWSFIKEENYGVDNSRVAGICANTDDMKSDDNAFLSVAKNPETIFGWDTDANIYSQTYLNPFNNGSDMTDHAYYQIDNALWAKMSDNDYRKSRYMTEAATFPYFNIVSGDSTWYPTKVPAYTSLKWAATIASDQSVRSHEKDHSDVILFRTSEVVLMLAEAYAQSGNDTEAKNTLNKLLAARTKAGAPTMTCDNTMAGMSTLDMCKLQWRLECWAENGWNFWNAKRWNQAPTYEGSNHWSTNAVTIEHMTWEIPDKETQTNPHWASVSR